MQGGNYAEKSDKPHPNGRGNQKLYQRSSGRGGKVHRLVYRQHLLRAPAGAGALRRGGEDRRGPGDRADYWAYNISPGLLVAYKKGELEAWKLSGLVRVLACEVSELINRKMDDILVSYFAGRRQSQ